MTDRSLHLSNASFRRALFGLLEGVRYAQDTDHGVWTFAIELGSLREDGLSLNDLRWLVCAGYVEHAEETTEDADTERTFRQVSNLKFASNTCFVLTKAGVSLAEELLEERGQLGAPASAPRSGVNNGQEDDRELDEPTPKWNPHRRELCMNGRLVKRFRLPSPNQEAVLAAFEEEGWPEIIDDPLPQEGSQPPKRRLQDTLKALNRHQTNKLISFKGDGTGEGVLWEWTEGASENGDS